MGTQPEIVKELIKEEKKGLLSRPAQENDWIKERSSENTTIEHADSSHDSSVGSCKDIGKETSLLPSQQKNDSFDEKEILFQGSSNIIMYFDTKGRVIKANDSSIILSGFSRDEILGKSFLELHKSISKENFKIYMKVFKKTLLGKKTEHFIGQLYEKNGKEHIIDFSAYPLIKQGIVYQVLLIGNDITKEKETENLYQLITENTSDLIAMTTFSLKPVYTYVSPSYQSILGLNPSQMLGENSLEYVHPDDKKILTSLLKKYFSHKAKDVFHKRKQEFMETFECRMKHADGSYHNVQCTANLIGKDIVLISKDITKQKKAEEALKRSEKKYRMFVDTAADFMFIVNKDGKLTDVNTSMVKNLKYTSNELLGKKITDLFPRSVFEQTITPLWNDFESTGHLHTETFLQSKDHQTIYGTLNGVAIYDDSNQYVGSRFVFHDLTDRKKIEDELTETKNHFQMLFNFMADPVMILDKKGKFLELTEKVKEITGWDREEIIGKNFLMTKLLTKKSKAICIKNLMKRMSGISVSPYEVEAVTKDGQIIPFEINAQRIIYKKQPADLVVFRDISERKKIQEVLKQNERKLSEILNGTPIPTFVIDKSHTIIHWNKAIEQLTGISAQQIIGTKRHWSAFYEEKRPIFADLLVDEASKETIDAYYKGKYHHSSIDSKAYRIEDFFPRLGTNGVWLDFTATLLKDTDGRIIGAIESLQDISTRKKAEKEATQAHEELQKLNKNLEKTVQERTEQIQDLLKQKDEFINQLGHDLKNPLGPLINLLPILKKEADNEKHVEIFDVLIRNVNHMKNLVTKTIQLAQLQAPNKTLKLEEVNLADELEDILEKHKLYFDTHQITVDNTISSSFCIQADRLLLAELFDNLISNATKYSSDGASIVISAQSKDDEIQIAIQDTGIGMNKKQLDHLFDEFYKADPARHDFDSSGLGLSICKRIVEKHGGSIWAESKGIGKGSTIAFNLKKQPSK